MYRLLIADSSKAMTKLIGRQLENEMRIFCCNDPEKVLGGIVSFEPDILYLDMQLLGEESWILLDTLRNAGKAVKTIVASTVVNDVIAARLTYYNVSCWVSKPCLSGHVVAGIRDLCFRLDHPEISDWCVENEIDRILLNLGFRMGPSRYRCVFEAVLERYHSPESSMKELYIDVAKRCGGNYQRIEKAVRDAIEDAYACGNEDLWAMYFSASQKRGKPYPGNEEFIARIARCLVQRARIRKPCCVTRDAVK